MINYDQRQHYIDWIESTIVAAVCIGSIVAVFAMSVQTMVGAQ